MSLWIRLCNYTYVHTYIHTTRRGGNVQNRSRCYTEKAREARQRRERQYNTRANRKKQCRPNETKPYCNATHPHERQTRRQEQV